MGWTMVAWWFGEALAAPLSLPAPPPSPARVEVTVLDEVRPVEGLDVVVEGVIAASTDERGVAELSVDPGRQFVQVLQGDQLVAEIDLVTLAGEDVVMRVVRERGERARVDVAEPSNHRGAIVGTVVEVDGRTPVAGARLRFGARTTRSNRDGSYAMELPAGDYSLVVEPRDGPAWRVDHVRAVPDHRVLADVEILPQGVQLRHYEVLGSYVEGDIARQIAAQREVSSIEDAWGPDRVAATGARTVAEALDRVPGVTVELGRYVMFRGQPARYGTTTWNGSPLPSPEPFVPLMPLDILPAGILSSLDVQRAYSADRPAGFGAGAVDLHTVRMPEDPFLDLSLSSALVSQSTFSFANDYRGGRRDFFGFDDGRRALPEAVANIGDLTRLDEAQQNEVARTFSPFVSQQSRSSLPPDLGLALTAGGRVPVGRGSLGALAAITFRNRWRNQFRSENTLRRFRYERTFDPGRRSRSESRTDNDVDIGAVLALNGRFRNHVITANTLYAHLAQQRTSETFSFREFGYYGYYQPYYGYYEPVGGAADFTEGALLSWVERQLVAQQVTSRHDLGKLRIDARAMIARADRDAPDRRTYTFEERRYTRTYNGYPYSSYQRVPSDDGLLREFETVREDVRSFGVDASLAVADPVDRAVGVVLKAGVSGHARDRTAQTLRYQWLPIAGLPGYGNPYEYYGYYGYYGYYRSRADRLYDPNNTGTTLDFNDLSSVDPDDVIARERAIGGYGLADVHLGDRAELQAGLRFESSFAEATTFRRRPTEADAISSTYRQRRFCLGKPECGLFPSASVVARPLDRLRVWAAWGRSVARPNLHEIASAPFVEPESGETLVGAQNLRPTRIDGLDLAGIWDLSDDSGIRLGGFLRDYRDVVERVHLTGDINDHAGTFQNLERARTLGLEVGGRARFGRLYTLGDVVLTQNAVRVTSFLTQNRPLDDQVTWTLDVQGGYLRNAHDVGVMLDIVGRRQRRAAAEGRDPVFLQPIPRLALYWNWEAYRSEDTVGGLQVRLANLPDPVWRFLQSPDLEFDDRQDVVWRDYRRGFALTANLTIGVR